MTKELAITTAKQFRVDADALLQRMKQHKTALMSKAHGEPSLADACDDASEVVAQHILSCRDLESAIMRQGMALKSIGNPNPYPDSYKPENTVVNPTADGLKL